MLEQPFVVDPSVVDVSLNDYKGETIIAFTIGEDLLAQLEEVKRETVAEATRGWSRDEIAAFADLYDRFTAGLERQTAQLDALERQAEETPPG